MRVALLAVLAAGCWSPAERLGDGTLAGRLPSGWEEAERGPGEVLRVQEPVVPLFWTLVITPNDVAGQEWERVGEVTETVEAPFPKGHPDHGTPITVPKWVYTGTVGRRPLQATVDQNLDERTVERFLDSLRATD